MKDDEGRHATVALESGGVTLPIPVSLLMRAVSRVMTRIAYYV
jgi:ubiquinone biosynthesis monooxygenase Coq7